MLAQPVEWDGAATKNGNQDVTLLKTISGFKQRHTFPQQSISADIENFLLMWKRTVLRR